MRVFRITQAQHDERPWPSCPLCREPGRPGYALQVRRGFHTREAGICWVIGTDTRTENR